MEYVHSQTSLEQTNNVRVKIETYGNLMYRSLLGVVLCYFLMVAYIWWFSGP